MAPMSMSMNRLKWLAIALPLAFVAFLRLTTESAPSGFVSDWQAQAAFFAALAVGVFFFATAIFTWLDRTQKASDARTRELEALNDLGRKLTGPVDREAVVTMVLETAHEILGARAVGVALPGAGGERVWRAIGDSKSDLEHAAIAGRATFERGSAQVVTDGGESALLVTAPMAVRDGPGALVALLASDTSSSLISVTRLMSGLANHATAALERGRLFEDVQHREQRSRALYEVGLEIVSSQDLDRVLRQVTNHACKLAHGRSAALCLLSGNPERLSMVQTAGDATILSNGRGDVLGPASIAIRPRVGDEPALNCPMVAEPHDGRAVRSPLVVGNTVVGELCVIYDQQRDATPEERALLAGLADMAAIAIHNARLKDGERQVAVLEERDRLAREMHDSLAQVLGYLHLKAATTRKRLAAGDVERAEEELQEMQDLAHEAYVDVREAILGLRETVASAGGLAGSLRQYLQKFRRQSGIEARLLAPDGAVAPLPPESEVQLLRVVQEALTNVRKHADAASAVVTLDNQDGGLRIVIEDNGCGFDSSRLDREEGRSFGLRSMQERVEQVGGRFTVESSPGAGTRIVVQLPSDPAAIR